MESIIKNLDFSGGKNSWFDLWHTHLDWHGRGNESWNLRKQFLDKLLTAFNNIKSELKNYPKDYQTWIVISENDSAEDAVYIHSKNPNAENFPLKVQTDKNVKGSNVNLLHFMESTSLEIVRCENENGNYFYLFDKNYGISLI